MNSAALPPDLRMREFGRRKAEELLDTAAKNIRRAQESQDEDSVHKLRVSIRRMQQALRLFRQFLRPKGVAAVRTDLRAILQETGAVRNHDIAAKLVAPNNGLVNRLNAAREEARGKLAQVLNETADAWFAEDWKEALGLTEGASTKKKKIRKKDKLWRGKKTVGDNLRRELPAMAQAWFAEGHKALQPGRAWDEMHRFRLLTKRFRYTLEIFRDAWGPGLDRRIESLRDLQTLLGDINDAVVTGGMLEAHPRSEKRRARLAEVAAKKTESLHQHWTKTFGSPEAESAWIRYLTLYACRAPRQKMRNSAQNAPEAAS